MNQIANVQQAELTLTIVSGPDKGAVYKLVSQAVKIGRAVDNDILLKDPRSSRHHAVIDFTAEGIFISNRSASSPIEVDGVKAERTKLRAGANILIGSTLLRFDIKTMSTQLPELGPLPAAGLSIPQSVHSVPSQVHRPQDYVQNVDRSFKMQKSKLPLFAGIGLILTLLMFGLGGSQTASEPEAELRTNSIIDEDIKSTQDRLMTLEKEQLKRGIGTQEYKDIQALLTQGLRDYREGQYSRALLALDSALALRPDSEVARKYRDLSKRRFDELIQTTMLEAKRYREQGKHQLAANAYRQVTIFISDPKNKQYQEAEQLAKESELLIRGAY